MSIHVPLQFSVSFSAGEYGSSESSHMCWDHFPTGNKANKPAIINMTILCNSYISSYIYVKVYTCKLIFTCLRFYYSFLDSTARCPILMMSRKPTSSFLHLCMFMGFSSSSSRALHLVLSRRSSRCTWYSSRLCKGQEHTDHSGSPCICQKELSLHVYDHTI